MPIRVIVADDHPIVLEGLAQLFNIEKDFQVVEQCSSGAQALDAVLRLKPDVLVLDVRIPKVDGLSVLRELAARRLVPEARGWLTNARNRCPPKARLDSAGRYPFFTCSRSVLAPHERAARRAGHEHASRRLSEPRLGRRPLAMLVRSRRGRRRGARVSYREPRDRRRPCQSNQNATDSDVGP